MVGLSGRIKQLRKAAGLTQKELAERVGVTVATISAIETDIRKPSFDVLIKLAMYFHVSTDYLLGVGGQSVLHSGETLDVSNLTNDQIDLLLKLINEFTK